MNESNDDRDEASLLDEFFSEIEKLTIQDKDEDRGEHDTDLKPSGENIKTGDQIRAKEKEKQKQQRSMIDRADTTKDNWKKFVIEEAASSPVPPSQSSFITTPGRKPISFSLGCASSAKKKKNSKIMRRQTRENRPAAPPAAFTNETLSHSQPMARSSDRFNPPFNADRILIPRWIAVLDTCAVLESYESVCDMIQLAKEAAKKSALPPMAILEDLTIVLPYTVWDELDYRSKEVDDEHQRYKARRAARMLTDELQNQPQQQTQNQQRVHGFSQQNEGSNTPYIQSQSRIESHRAVEEFVALSKTTKIDIPNDDKILACALWQLDRHAKSTAIDMLPATAGGVVLITSDKVLTGKARADGLAVYNSVEFVQYYKKRMASLRSRTSVEAHRGATMTP